MFIYIIVVVYLSSIHASRFHYQSFIDSSNLLITGSANCGRNEKNQCTFGGNNDSKGGGIYTNFNLDCRDGFVLSFILEYPDFTKISQFTLDMVDNVNFLHSKNNGMHKYGEAIKNTGSLSFIFYVNPAHDDFETSIRVSLSQTLNNEVKELSFISITFPDVIPKTPKIRFIVKVTNNELSLSVAHRHHLPPFKIPHSYPISKITRIGFSANNMQELKLDAFDWTNKNQLQHDKDCMPGFHGPECTPDERDNAFNCGLVFDCRACTDHVKYCGWCTDLKKCLSVTHANLHFSLLINNYQCEAESYHSVTMIRLFLFLLLGFFMVGSLALRMLYPPNLNKAVHFLSSFSYAATVGGFLAVVYAFFIIHTLTEIAEDVHVGYFFALLMLLCSIYVIIGVKAYFINKDYVLFRSSVILSYNLTLPVSSLLLFTISNDWYLKLPSLSRLIYFSIFAMAAALFYLFLSLAIVSNLHKNLKNFLNEIFCANNFSNGFLSILAFVLPFYALYCGYVYSRLDIPTNYLNNKGYRSLYISNHINKSYVYEFAIVIGTIASLVTEYWRLNNIIIKSNTHDDNGYSFKITSKNSLNSFGFLLYHETESIAADDGL